MRSQLLSCIFFLALGLQAPGSALCARESLPQAAASLPSSQSLQEGVEQAYFDEDHLLGPVALYTVGPLLDMYRENGFQRLWTSRERVEELEQAVLASADDGLEPKDYHLDIISESKEFLTQGAPLSFERDIILSDAFILLAEHLRHGKLSSLDVEERAGLAAAIPTVDADAKAYLAAIQSGEISRALREYAPGHQAYQDLKAGLAAYKKMAAQGEWPKTPEGASLKPGMRGPRVSALKARLVASGELAAEEAADDLYNHKLQEAVSAFQKQHGLEADGLAGKNTLAALNVPVSSRIQQIRANLERTRWLLHELPEQAVLVDIAGFGLDYRQGGRTVWTSRVMVGQPYNQTPAFRSAINWLVINPSWTVPPGMVKKEIIPALNKNPDYLSAAGLYAVTLKGELVDPYTVDWARYLGRNCPYQFKQAPGPSNSLGRIKFLFPNPYHVYLHDTPKTGLFNRQRRALSHGCIRVQAPLQLARLLLAADPGNPVSVKQFEALMASGKSTGIALKKPVPVFLLYSTAKGEKDGKVRFSPDLYGRDAALIAALDKQPRALPQRPLLVTEDTAKAEPEAQENSTKTESAPSSGVGE